MQQQVQCGEGQACGGGPSLLYSAKGRLKAESGTEIEKENRPKHKTVLGEAEARGASKYPQQHLTPNSAQLLPQLDSNPTPDSAEENMSPFLSIKNYLLSLRCSTQDVWFSRKMTRHTKTKQNKNKQNPHNTLPKHNTINRTRVRYDTDVGTNQCNLMQL